MEFRPRGAGLGATGAGWSWSRDDAAASGTTSGESSSAANEDWATASGYSSATTPRPTASDKDAATSTAHDIPRAFPTRPVAVGESSGASDASWITEEETHTPETPTEDRRQHDFHHDHHPQVAEEDEELRRYKLRFKPRTCRICLETIEPTFEDAGGDGDDGHDEDDEDAAAAAAAAAGEAGVAGFGAVGAAVGEAAAGLRDRVAAALPKMPTFLRSSPQMPRVRYVSSDPADGRLISPCRCKGSQKYVHEGCLQAWRHAQPLADRNFWTCPTCGFAYRVERLRWGRLVSSRAARALLTVLVFALTLFLLGFVADPLLDLWLDPGGVLIDTFVDWDLDDYDLAADHHHYHDDAGILGGLHDVLGNHDTVDDAGSAISWVEHFLKGFFSLGLVGVVKTFFAVSPWTWWNMRSAGIGRARRRAGGRARVEGMGWVFILVGAFTFLGAAWKGINYVSGRILERASEHIVDIGADDDDGDDEGDDGHDDTGHAENRGG